MNTLVGPKPLIQFYLDPTGICRFIPVCLLIDHCHSFLLSSSIDSGHSLLPSDICLLRAREFVQPGYDYRPRQWRSVPEKNEEATFTSTFLFLFREEQHFIRDLL